MSNMPGVIPGGNTQPLPPQGGKPEKAADSQAAEDFASQMDKSAKGSDGELLTDRKSAGRSANPFGDFEKSAEGELLSTRHAAEKQAGKLSEQKQTGKPSEQGLDALRTAKEGKHADHKAEFMEEDMTEKSPADLMRSLSQGKTTAPTNINVTETAAVQQTNASESVEKINKIVDRIMLAEAGSTKEARISFSQDFLPGTEVMIRKEGGQLSVEFATTSPESFDFLSKNEQSLMSQLQNKFGDAEVSVNMQQSQMEQEEDGRSRNEFVAEDDDDDERQNS